MKLTDGKKTVEIEIRKWNGTGYDPDFSLDYFDAGSLPYDEELGAYIVEDVDYCIDMAMSEDDEGARYVTGEDGESYIDEDIVIDVTDID